MDLKSVICGIACMTVVCSAEILTQFNSQMKSADNQYIVRLSSESKREEFLLKMNQSPLFDVQKSTRVGENYVFLLRSKTQMGEFEIQQNLEDHFGSFIDYASNNFIVESYGTNLAPYDCSSDTDEAPCQSHPSGIDAWGLSRISQIDSISESESLEYKWSDSNDGSGVTIYIVDSGVYDSHNEFSDIEARWGFTSTLISARENDEDLNGHGTHVAGIAAGKSYGVAKKANIVAVKVLDASGSGSAYDVLEGLSFIIDDFLSNFEQQGRRPKAVVNLSLGLNGILLLMNDAIRHGSKMGIIYVAAAGNSATDACTVSPSNSRDAITVAAVDIYDKLSSFSNRGSCVDILAPGSMIKSAGIDHPSDTETYQGTSMASPFVAGVVARYLSHRDNATNITCVKEHLFDTAIHGQATIPDYATPNRMLFAGCNTCFGNRDCDVIFDTEIDTPWTLPTLGEIPDNSGIKVQFCYTNYFTFVSIIIFLHILSIQF